MNFRYLFFLFLSTNYSLVKAQGVLLESLSLESSWLKKPMKYSIYLPEGYSSDTRSYPVLYLLHGYSDNETAWAQFGEMKKTADQSIETGEATPMIIVMPDAWISWYINSSDGHFPYESYFFEEFIPFIEKTYRIRSEKQYRAVAGLSMGGFGSLVYALKHADMFGSCASLSAAIRTEEETLKRSQEEWDRMMGVAFGTGKAGKSRLGKEIVDHSPYHMVANGNAENFKTVRYYIDCGDDDHLFQGNLEFAALLKKKGIPFEFRMREGGHTWSYWRTALPEVLKFVSVGFRR